MRIPKVSLYRRVRKEGKGYRYVRINLGRGRRPANLEPPYYLRHTAEDGSQPWTFFSGSLKTLLRQGISSKRCLKRRLRGFCSPLHLLIGGCTPPQNATLTNTGNATLYLYGVTLTSATGYFSTTNNCPTQLEPGQSCIITVSFGAPIPRKQAMYSATLVVNDTASNPQQIALTGTASPD